jgi:hypothetical protein
MEADNIEKKYTEADLKKVFEDAKKKEMNRGEMKDKFIDWHHYCYAYFGDKKKGA